MGHMGRPSSYKPEYCDMLINHMKEGLSFESFAADVNSCKDTIYKWTKKYPEFAYAKKKGHSLCLKFWEKLGRAGTAGKIPNFNATSWIFNMKNRFFWRNEPDTSGIDEEIEYPEI